MKSLFFLAIAATTLLMSSCSKEGDTGPTGPAGNANVRVINYGSRTFSGITEYVIPQVSQAFIDSSLVLVYYNPSTETAGSWYPAPGIGPAAVFETRYFLFPTPATPGTFALSLRAHTTGSTNLFPSSLTFTKTRIFIVPANNLVAGRNNTPPDLSDYNSVCEYYNIAK